MRVIGIDLAWGEGTTSKAANETGAVAVDADGTVVAADWPVGLDQTVDWIEARASEDTLTMVDAPLVVNNPTDQRTCERQVGQRYGRWKVAANSTNLGSKRLAGQALRIRLGALGWAYASGWGGPPQGGHTLHECYPYTTLVGAEELGYHDERPVYKRKPKSMKTLEFKSFRSQNCDELVKRFGAFENADPPLRLRSHPATAMLLDEPSPLGNAAYKHREDLIDAVLCAWTGLLWIRHGLQRCQILGDTGDEAATMVAPARPTQRP